MRRALIPVAVVAASALFAASASAAPTFAPASNFPTGSGPTFPTAADFNEDGDLDIAVAITNNDRIEVRLGNGDGTFASPTNFAAGDRPDQVISADINLDSNVDLLAPNSGINDSTITILLGNGAGGFTTSTVSLAPEKSIIRVAVGLIDGDSFPDLAATSVNPSKISVLLGNGDGTFDPPATFTSGGVNPVGVAIALINPGPNTDLVVMNNASHNFAVLLGDGLGGFGSPTLYSTGNCFPNCSPGTALVRDFNGDGFLDVVTEVGFPPAGSVSVSLGNGAGTFAPFTLYATGGSGPNNTVTADFDGDGKPDLATSNVATGNASVLTGNGNGTFNAGVAFATGSGPVGLDTADFNGDGRPDLAVANLNANNVSILLNTTADTTPPTLNLPANITVEADGPGGSEVSFTVTATDSVDPNPTVNCTPPSGSLFPIGTTNVNCTATDNSGNVANGSFTVTVTDTERSDLEIEKFASHTKASPGENVTYSFRVTNHGPSAANNVTVRDPGSAHLNFISGDPGCSVVASEIVCNFGTLANGATQTKNVVLQLHPSHHSGEAPTQHDLDILKLEQFVSVPGNELNYPEHSLSCPAGYTATDGSARTDSVDQGTGTRPGEHDVENLHFVRSESNAANRRQWDFTLQNHATGQAQAHLFIVCLRDTTSSANGHSHALIHHPRVTGVLPIGAAGGRHEITLTCPVNTVAIAPSFEFTTTGPAPPAGGPNGPHGAQYKSIQSADGRNWTFGFQTAAAARVEVSIRCLGRETSSAGGHFEALNFHHVYKRATVGPFGGFGNSGPWSENRVECPVHYKGIVATWDLPRNVKTMGNTPEPINRDFRIFNKSSQPKFAHLDLLCLKNRTMDDLNGGSVRNNATVYGDEPDWNFANNLDFWDLEDPPLDPSGGGGSADGAGGGDGSGADPGAGEPGGAVDSGEGGEPDVALADDDAQAKLETCVKRALKIANKKKRRKAVKSCRREFGTG